MKPAKLPVFEVNDLRVEREAVILHDLSWRVEPGQHWVCSARTARARPRCSAR
jgi:ABC-type molybdenum transport system ATPase subunit/photorepair protein PhrA